MPPLPWDTLPPAALLQTTVPWVPYCVVRRTVCMGQPRDLSVRALLVLQSVLSQVGTPHIHNSALNQSVFFFFFN